MDNLDDSENNAKISDSAYSNSCSNSQSRRSHSSKSTHSGSNCSISSGYGGKPSTSGSSNKLEQTSKKEKVAKKKKQAQSQIEVIPAVEPVVVECRALEPIPLPDVPKEDTNDVVEVPLPPLALPEKAVENMDVSASDLTIIKDEMQIATMQANISANLETSCQIANFDTNGFSCAVSMHDGVVMYTTQNLTATLGFPKDMWIGRSFIDFVHPKDHNTFASQITNGLAVPNIVNDKPDKVPAQTITDCTMVCRIRRYRSLSVVFAVKNRSVTYMPFLLKFSLKDIKDDDGNIVYLIIQATPLYSAYKTPNETKKDATTFIIRHSAAGKLEYIDIESVPYLGYIPQDIHNHNALSMYHPDDLPYLKMIYETIVKEGSMSKCMPYRMLTQNGDYVKLKTEWSSFINPWSMKLEFVIGKHHVLEGPTSPDVFLSPPPTKVAKTSPEDKLNAQQAEAHRESILRILKNVLTKPAEKAREQMSKRCQDLAMIMESLLEEQPKPEEELSVEIQEPDLNSYERDSVMLGGISPHHENNDSKSSTETPLSYNQLNYMENLQRYFDSHRNYRFEESRTSAGAPGVVVARSEPQPSTSKDIMFPSLHKSIDSMEIGSSESLTAPMPNCVSLPNANIHPRLTEKLLTKHNSKMEKELANNRRGSRSSIKGQPPSEARQKKKEHLARCNASFQPTMAGAASEAAQVNVLKRHMSFTESEIPKKQFRHSRCHNVNAVASAQPQVTAINTGATPSPWQNASNPTPMDMNSYGLGMHSQPQMPMMPPQMPGLFSMCYGPTALTASHLKATPSTSTQPTHMHTQDATQLYQQNTQQFSQQQMMPQQMQTYPVPTTQMPWMYPQQTMYGSTYIFPQMPYNLQQQTLMPQAMNYNQSFNPSFNQSLNPLGLTNSNYIQACKSSLPPTPNPAEQATWKGADTMRTSSTDVDQSSFGGSASIALNRDSESRPKKHPDQKQPQSTERVPAMPRQYAQQVSSGQSGQTSDEAIDKTDGESSYSSFYSSFFKTESGSAEESSDPNKAANQVKKNPADAAAVYTYEKAPRSKIFPPWMEQVCVTPDLIFKYQILPRPKEEVLKTDLEKIKAYVQPDLVNEQLGQLYKDLQLGGFSTLLTLEEGLNSSSSSGEENFRTPKRKAPRRKREYSKLNMVFEEDTPLPSPSESEDQCLEPCTPMEL